MTRISRLLRYRRFMLRKPPTCYKPAASRPKGELVWIHAPHPESTQAIIDLAKRLCGHRHRLNILITGTRLKTPPCPNILTDKAPSEHPHDIKLFLEHWKPNLLLWSWGELRSNLLLTAHESAVPMIMIDADQRGFSNRLERWFPHILRDVLSCFQNILARDEATHNRLQKILRKSKALEHSGPLRAGGQVLDFSESDFDELTRTLSGRPLWFAAAVQANEVHMVLAAHRHALRVSHRLLLVLNPASEARTEACLEQLQMEGLRHAFWEEGEFPDENCQVLLVTSQDESGLWYRLSPLSFLGSSLSFGQSGLDPYQAAALGTAVLYGPNVRNHMSSYSRLAAAGAARIVNSSNALGVAVAQLMTPDQMAAMALAGWDVVTQGADITDRIIALSLASLEASEEG